MLIQDHTAYRIWESETIERERQWLRLQGDIEYKPPRRSLQAFLLALAVHSLFRSY